MGLVPNPRYLQEGIERFFRCHATHLGTHTPEAGEPWQGIVESFSLSPPFPAPYCYAVVEPSGEFAFVPHLPPVVSPRTAIAARLASRRPAAV